MIARDARKKHTVAPCCSRPEQEDLLMMSVHAHAQVTGVECGAMAKEAETRTSRGSSKQYIW